MFRPGNYGAKGTYTDADIDAMAGNAALPIRMGHYPTLIEKSGGLGACTRQFAGFDEAGQKVLMGEWSEPVPLGQLLGDLPRSLSVEIDLNTKMPVAVALEVNPHIKDAAFFAQQVDTAFVKFSKGEEVAAFRYESESERDAIPAEDFGDPDQKLFPVRTQAEFRSAMEELGNAADPTAVKARILEIAARKGLKTDAYPWYSSEGMSKPLSAYDNYALYSKENPMPTENAATPAQEAAKPSWKEQIVALFSGAKPEDLAEAHTALVTAQTGKTPRELELEAELATFKAEQVLTRGGLIVGEAEKHYDALYAANKCAPADKEQIVAAFTAAQLFDANAEAKADVACFAEGAPQAKFSLVKFMDETLAKLPAHKKTEEQAGGLAADQVAVFEQSKTTSTDATTGETIAVVDGTLARQRKELLAANKS